ncbi:MAG: DUF1549 domain-containing protein [Verrucomicrobiota bacterium]
MAAEEAINFNRDIRPILSDKCFYCHGPDPEHRKADLRLDTLEGALADLGGYQAIVPGNAEDSEFWYRVDTDDDFDMMPPEDSGKSLTQREKDLLKRWINEGAEYEAHWSLIPSKRGDLPETKQADWARNAIDHFILARLESEGLKPSPEASREALIRRVTLDLTGLPPTPAEVDAFLADNSPNAWEKVVDRLLDSDRYGERMTLDWLDAARYADTNGYQKDTERQMWIWRDWVINAFNENKPFDEFTVEQVAGDMLPNATLDQRIASGFNRNHRINGEGGVIPEEYRVEYVVDRLETTGTIWLGMTIGCARCHTHKFDPITHKDFFQMFAYFNNVPENGRDGNKGNATPMIDVPIPNMQPKVAAAEQKVQDLRQALNLNSPEFLEDLERWRAKTAAQLAAGELGANWSLANVTEASTNSKVALDRLEDGSFLATGPNPPNPTYTLKIAPGEGVVTAIRLETLTHPNMTKKGLSRSVNGNFVLTEVEILVHRPDMNEPQQLQIASAEAAYSQNNYPIANAIDGNKNSGWAVLGRSKIEDTPAMFVLAEALETDSDTTLIVRLKHDARFEQHAIGRLRLSLT